MRAPPISISLLAVTSVFAQDSQEARAILEKAALATQSGPSYRGEFTGTQEDKATGFDRRTEFGGTITFQSPSRLRAEMKLGPSERWTIRDGLVTWLYDPKAKQYRRVVSTTAIVADVGSVDPSSLFGIVGTGVVSARIAPDEDILEGSPIRCYVIAVEYEAGTALASVPPRATYWIDKTSYVVLRRRIVAPARYAQASDPVERTVELAFTKVTYSPTLTGSEFGFTPPEGATLMPMSQVAGTGSSPSPQGVYRIGNGVSAPRVISKIEPRYSEEARLAGLEGTVVLSLVVDEAGLPKNIKALKGLGLGLDEKAIEAVQAWRFAPGQKEGNPVPILATIQVNFRLLGPPGSWRLDRAVFNLPAGASRPLLRKREFPPAIKTQTADSVTVRLQVDENGNAADIHVEKSSDPKWEEEVIAAVQKWKFDPSVAGGTKVAVPLTLEFSRAGTPTASVPVPPATAPQ